MARKHPKKSDSRILILDIGGTHVKVLVTGLKQPIEIPSGIRRMLSNGVQLRMCYLPELNCPFSRAIQWRRAPTPCV